MKPFVRVEPMPDELSLSHEARIAWANGTRSLAELTALIRTTLAGQGCATEGLPRLHQLALVSKKTPTEYIRSHSMIATVRVAAKRGADLPHCAPSAHEYARQHGMRTQRSGAYCCTKCIQEDCQATSFSWYRRKHHLIGVDWCHVHGDTLHQVDDPRPFLQPPHIWVSEGKLVPIQACAPTLPEEGFLSRYVNIACALLDRPRPYCVEIIGPRLSQRAMESNLRVGPKGRRPLISDRLFELAPADWLKEHLRGSDQKVPLVTFRRIDFVARSKSTASPGYAYAMAAATLYHTADAAMLDLSLAAEADATSEPKRLNRRGDKFWEGEIWQYYLASNGVHSQIASGLGMEPTYLAERLTALGLPSLFARGPDELGAWRAFERFSNGESLAAACAHEGVEGGELEELLRKCSIRVFRAIQKIQAKPNTKKKGGAAHLEERKRRKL